MRGVLCLEDGFAIQGELTNYTAETVGEVVFFTGMTGYEEALTDPSYRGQILVFTFPMIGTYGVPEGSGQSPRIMVRGLVARDLWDTPQDRAATPLSRVLEASGCPALHGINTRELVLHLREHGCKKGVLTALPGGGLTPGTIGRLRGCAASFNMKRVVEEVACEDVEIEPAVGLPPRTCVLVDFGVKSRITRELLGLGYRVVRVPPKTSAGGILAWHPDCVMLSNGPGDPEDNREAIDAAAALLGQVPIFGICLGHQILAKAAGARIVKLKYGHHGSNHPVKDLGTGSAVITSQNHNYAAGEDHLPACVSITHLNLNDGTIEGMEIRDDAGKVLSASLQFHPEGAAGPPYHRFWSYLEGGHPRA